MTRQKFSAGLIYIYCKKSLLYTYLSPHQAATGSPSTVVVSHGTNLSLANRVNQFNLYDFPPKIAKKKLSAQIVRKKLNTGFVLTCPISRQLKALI